MPSARAISSLFSLQALGILVREAWIYNSPR